MKTIKSLNKKSLSQNKKKLFSCPECGLRYRDKDLAKKCQQWCKKYHSCNIEIASLAERE
ncbi:MAG: hypothetical protein KatS3mg098_033 [Candidatus Parcubacteria bacterium]|nr:hypothetical protein [Patescibacteria group bacterium]BCX15804.1 MAG: hypothetical protein KatS3mg098_033 [Candidatus Parcubacteria bacterium]